MPPDYVVLVESGGRAVHDNYVEYRRRCVVVARRRRQEVYCPYANAENAIIGDSLFW